MPFCFLYEIVVFNFQGKVLSYFLIIKQLTGSTSSSLPTGKVKRKQFIFQTGFCFLGTQTPSTREL